MTRFKIGDVVKIIKPCDKRVTYKDMFGKTGIVQHIITYLYKATYYIAVDGCINPCQDNGWFVYSENEICCVDPAQTAQRNCVDYYMGGIKVGRVITEDGYQINLKENEKMGVYVGETNIVDLYFENENGKILKKYQEKEKRLMKKDVIVAQIEAFKQQMKDVKNLKINYDYEFPQEIKEKLEKLNVERDHERDILRDLVLEIKIMVKECETYEQKQNILKAYEVIDEQGKLIK